MTFTPGNLREIAGISYRQIQYWDRIGLLPAKRVHNRKTQTRGFRYFDENDVIITLAAVEFRSRGVSIQKIKKTAPKLRALLEPLDELVGWLVCVPGQDPVVFPDQCFESYGKARDWWFRINPMVQVLSIGDLWVKLNNWQKKNRVGAWPVPKPDPAPVVVLEGP